MSEILRIGLIGAGANTRSRHIPGFQAIAGVTLTAVCNRRPESTEAIAREYDVPRQYSRWEDLVADPEVDAVMIGTWPYLHCPITLAALEAGKHVLTEAHMAMNAAEAKRMLEAARAHPKLVTQVVPSPFGLKGHALMRSLIDGGFLGKLREVMVFGLTAALADPATPLSWRQDVHLSGFNMLNLGILQETLGRWVAPPIRVQAQVQAHIASRIDPQSGVSRPVGTPDSVQVLATLADGACVTYHLSGAAPYGQTMGIHLYGTEGALRYDLLTDRIEAAGKSTGRKAEELGAMPIPADKAGAWRVEADFVDSIRLGQPVTLTNFANGLAYMEFTEAVARSAAEGTAVELPLDD